MDVNDAHGATTSAKQSDFSRRLSTVFSTIQRNRDQNMYLTVGQQVKKKRSYKTRKIKVGKISEAEEDEVSGSQISVSSIEVEDAGPSTFRKGQRTDEECLSVSPIKILEAQPGTSKMQRRKKKSEEEEEHLRSSGESDIAEEPNNAKKREQQNRRKPEEGLPSSSDSDVQELTASKSKKKERKNETKRTVNLPSSGGDSQETRTDNVQLNVSGQSSVEQHRSSPEPSPILAKKIDSIKKAFAFGKAVKTLKRQANQEDSTKHGGKEISPEFKAPKPKEKTLFGSSKNQSAKTPRGFPSTSADVSKTSKKGTPKMAANLQQCKATTPEESPSPCTSPVVSKTLPTISISKALANLQQFKAKRRDEPAHVPDTVSAKGGPPTESPRRQGTPSISGSVTSPPSVTQAQAPEDDRLKRKKTMNNLLSAARKLSQSQPAHVSQTGQSQVLSFQNDDFDDSIFEL